MYSKYCTHSEGEVKSTYVFKVLYTQGGGSEECVYVCTLRVCVPN